MYGCMYVYGSLLVARHLLRICLANRGMITATMLHLHLPLRQPAQMGEDLALPPSVPMHKYNPTHFPLCSSAAYSLFF